jgi:hypothetical protein
MLRLLLLEIYTGLCEAKQREVDQLYRAADPALTGCPVRSGRADLGPVFAALIRYGALCLKVLSATCEGQRTITTASHISF